MDTVDEGLYSKQRSKGLPILLQMKYFKEKNGQTLKKECRPAINGKINGEDIPIQTGLPSTASIISCHIKDKSTSCQVQD